MRLAAAIVLAFVLGLGAGCLLGAWRAAPARPPPQTLNLSVTDGGVYRVRSVVDGDTLVLENGLHVRYHGINAPEAGRFVKDPAPLSAEATARNIALVEGKRVRLKLARQPLDVHGRVIARVFVVPDGGTGEETEAGPVLVKEGLARALGLDMTLEESDAMKALEESAKAGQVGLWGLEAKGRAGKPYCAADKTAVYHLSTCSTAKRIAPANLHYYATPEEAAAAGLKPCSMCLRATGKP